MNDAWMEQLFRLQRDATCAVRGGILVFLNPAAQAFFSGAEPGTAADELLPMDVLEYEGATFTASTTVRDVICTVIASRVEDISVYTIIPQNVCSETEGRLLENVCSSMRRKLMVLDMTTDLLSATAERLDEPETQEPLIMISKTSYQLQRLCENLDSLGQLEKGQDALRVEVLDLVPFCGDLLQSVAHFAKQLGHKLHFQAEISELFMSIDKQKVTKLLLNLLSNSIGRLEGNGSIRVTVSKVGEDALITVKDSGAGVAPLRMPQVFAQYQAAPNYTDPQAGVGIGMAVCEKIATLHGGSLLLASQNGKGTTVSVRLPIRRIFGDGLLHDSLMPYGSARDGGMQSILIELSDVLGDAAFERKYRE